MVHPEDHPKLRHVTGAPPHQRHCGLLGERLGVLALGVVALEDL